MHASADWAATMPWNIEYRSYAGPAIPLREFADRGGKRLDHKSGPVRFTPRTRMMAVHDRHVESGRQRRGPVEAPNSNEPHSPRHRACMPDLRNVRLNLFDERQAHPEIRAIGRPKGTFWRAISLGRESGFCGIVSARPLIYEIASKSGPNAPSGCPSALSLDLAWNGVIFKWHARTISFTPNPQRNP